MIFSKKKDNYAHVSSKLDQPTAAVKNAQRDKYDGKGKDALTFGGDVLGNARARLR